MFGRYLSNKSGFYVLGNIVDHKDGSRSVALRNSKSRLYYLLRNFEIFESRVWSYGRKMDSRRPYHYRMVVKNPLLKSGLSLDDSVKLLIPHLRVSCDSLVTIF
jgi:hypothetical protein